VANPSGQITRAASTPDGAHGSFAGSVTYDGGGCTDPCHWRGILTLQPDELPLYGCNAYNWAHDSVQVIWDSGDQTAFPGTVSFDRQDFPLLIGIADQRLCLYIAYTSPPDLENNYTCAPADPYCPPGVEQEEFLVIPAPRAWFTVDPSQGGGTGGGGASTGGGGSAGSTPSTQQKTQTLSLSKKQATSRAKLALARKYGRAYKRGKRRLSCKRQSSSAYRCSFSLRYKKKRHSGSVTVRATAAGIKATVRAR
jgi:hypothetical protein